MPQTEHVSIPGIWVIEIFPPSQYSALEKSIRKNAWDKRRVQYRMGSPNVDMLGESRSRNGMAWWRLGEVNGKGAPFAPYPDGRTEELGTYFDAVELVAVQIGSGLTAVLAHFTLSEVGSTHVDRVWHANHEPALVRIGRGRPLAEDRHFSALRRTQKSRNGLHEAARNWLAKACPGAFVAAGEPQPLMDILLLEQHDPSQGHRIGYDLSEALRALGVGGDAGVIRASERLSGLLLDTDGEVGPGLRAKRTYTLWGNFHEVARGIPDLDSYGGQRDAHAVANYVDDAVQDFFVLLSVSDFLDVFEATYSKIRDRARKQHGRSKIRSLNRLRGSFLSLSLDLSSTVRDIAAFNASGGRYGGAIVFMSKYAPWVYGEGESSPDPRNINEMVKRRQVAQSERLAVVDKDYREILSTVASIGSSVDSYKLGRVALWVSLVSLFVSLVALSIAEIGEESILEILWRSVAS
ncbi:hypothetical protein [Streptomyces sp. MBT60]|uniref:hypothetical protein n=1 Tax=Streptomyces sp. MBT60 TaxID=2800409 RepID=UPI00190E498B|nr:hypothetical protein [Streptomyces sp. MBT60]MBK3542449.1 hypothetical protein [Streptomyces sp. MBT60]